MDASARIIYDQPYFEAFYSDWLAYRSKWRRFAIPFAVVMTASGTATISLIPQQTIFGVCVLVAGVYHLYESVTYRKRWISKSIKDLKADKTLDLVFRGEEISMQTPNTSGKFNVAALAEVVATPNGMFLVPRSGASIFVPRASIEPMEAFSPLIDSLNTAIQNTQTTIMQ